MVPSARARFIGLVSALALGGCVDGGGTTSESSGPKDSSSGGAATSGMSPTETGAATTAVEASDEAGSVASEASAASGTGGGLDTTSGDAETSGSTGEAGGTTSETGGETGEVTGSRCEETPTTVTCPKTTVELGPWQRDVHFQVPLGEAPASGWPVVMMFQGSFFSAEVTWVATDALPFGAIWQTRVVKQLLDHGYAVITPETKLNGGTFWDTNVPPYSIDWESSEDHELMLLLFAGIADGSFGPLDADRLFATGVSSGGYMTSRMAVSYPGKFRALAIAAGSYATCSGPLCSIPELPAGHPPTLFLHGEADLTVPLATAVEYYDDLIAAGVDARLVTAAGEGHGWIPASPDEVLGWFDGHP